MEEKTLDDVRRDAYWEVFFHFVLPACNELLSIGKYEAQGENLTVLQFLEAIRHQIVYGNDDDVRIDHFGCYWEPMKYWIDYFLKPQPASKHSRN